MEIADTWWKQCKGLMFSRRKKLLFVFPASRRVSIHTFFVFFPIKVSFLDEKKKPLEVVELKPFQVYKSRVAAKYMLEEPLTN